MTLLFLIALHLFWRCTIACYYCINTYTYGILYGFLTLVFQYFAKRKRHAKMPKPLTYIDYWILLTYIKVCGDFLFSSTFIWSPVRNCTHRSMHRTRHTYTIICVSDWSMINSFLYNAKYDIRNLVFPFISSQGHLLWCSSSYHPFLALHHYASWRGMS